MGQKPRRRAALQHKRTEGGVGASGAAAAAGCAGDVRGLACSVWKGCAGGGAKRDGGGREEEEEEEEMAASAVGRGRRRPANSSVPCSP